jgi:hypothetical protein
VPLQKQSDLTLDALLRKRIQIQTWLDSPAKKANLAAVDRQIVQHKRRSRAA